MPSKTQAAKAPRVNRKLIYLSVQAAIALLTSAKVHACIAIGNNATLFGTTDCIAWSGGNFTLTNTGTLISSSVPALTASASAGTLTNNGLLSGTSFAALESTASSLVVVNNATMTSNTVGILNNGTIASLTNTSTGSITGMSSGIGIRNNTAITSLSNSGVINGITGIRNFGTIGTLNNQATGLLDSTSQYALDNSTIGTIDLLNNDGTIRSSSIAVRNFGTIGNVINAGVITGIGSSGISNDTGGTIGTLTNSGTISGRWAIFNRGTINSLGNTGKLVGGTGSGIQNYATIGSLTNSGTISGTNGLYSKGSIGTLNNTGLITGTTKAIFLDTTSSTLTNFANAGTVAGAISNAGGALTISGGSGSIFGTLTGSGNGVGAGNMGLITNTASNVVFASGNQLLNDHINVGSNTVANTGATLQINNNVTITGNYTQAASGVLNIGVASGATATGVVSADSGYGRLVVTGSATFNAGSSVVLKPITTYSFAQGQKFVVAQATTANYNAGALNYSATGYNGVVTGASVVDSGNNALTDLILTLGSASSGSSSPVIRATTNDAISSLNGLFRYNGTNAGLLDMHNAAVALGSSAEANRAGAQLSPAANTASAAQSAQATAQAALSVISSHIDTLRTAQASGSGVSTGESASGNAFWGQAFGGQANQDNRGDTSGYRAGYSGLLIGADTAINDQWRIGGAFNYAYTSANGDGDNTGSSTHIKSYGVTGYGSFTAENWYMDLLGGIVQQKYKTLRSIGYTGFSGVGAGQFDGMQYIASVQAGYPIRLDATTTLTPIAGLTYTRLNQDAYTETGSVAALHVDSSSTSSVKSDLGAKLERVYKTSYGEVTPSVQLRWRHEYRDTSLRSVANFAADTSGATSFTTQGAAPSTNTGVLVLGATLARSQNLSLAGHYTLEAAPGYTAQTADVRLRYEF